MYTKKAIDDLLNARDAADKEAQALSVQASVAIARYKELQRRAHLECPHDEGLIVHEMPRGEDEYGMILDGREYSGYCKLCAKWLYRWETNYRRDAPKNWQALERDTVTERPPHCSWARG